MRKRSFAKTPKELEETADLGVDMVEPTNEGLEVVELELADMVELVDV